MANPANHLVELLGLAKQLDLQIVFVFRRIVSRKESGAPWFVWVAIGNDGGELGRSQEFRFCTPCAEEVSADIVRTAC
jgi:hypothetical protein